MNDPLLLEDRNLQRRDTRRAWLVMTGSVVLLLFIAGSVFFLDESPPDDEDFLPKFTTPAGKLNPLLAYIVEVDKLPKNRKDSLGSRETSMLPGSEPKLEAFLAQRSDLLEAWQRLVKTDPATWRYPRPEPDDPFHVKLNMDQQWIPAMGLGKYRAILYARVGKKEEAVEYVLQMLKFWKDMQYTEGGLHLYFTSVMASRWAMSTLETVLTETAIDAPLLAKVQAALDAENLCRMTTLAHATQVSYLQISLDITLPDFRERYKKQLYDDGEELAFTLLFKRNQSKRLFLELNRPVLTALNQMDRDAYMLAATNHYLRRSDFKIKDWKDLINPNAGNILFLENQDLAWDSVIDSCHYAKTRLNMIKIMLALRMHELRHGHLPEKLFS